MNVLHRLPVGALGRGTLASTVGLIVRAALQAVYLVLVSRWLGAEGYGLFAGSVAAVIVFAPLATGGMGLVYTERLTRLPTSARALWSLIASQAMLSGGAVALVVLALVALFLPIRLPLIEMGLLILAELVALPLVQTSTAALMAQREVSLANLTVVAVPLLRVLAVLILFVAGADADAGLLVIAHCTGTLVAAVWAAIVTHCVAAGGGNVVPAADGGRRALAREGAPYALGAWVGTSYAEIDKVLVLQLLGAGPAGIYTAAYRVVSVLILPVNALLSNALPRLFAAQLAGGFAQVLRTVALAAFGYSLLGAAVAVVFAALIPLVFGAEYAGSSRYVLLFAVWVPLATLHLTGANALLAAGGKLQRMTIEGIGLLVIAGVTVGLVPRIGAEGAVAGLLAAEAIMALGCWVALGRQRKMTNLR